MANKSGIVSKHGAAPTQILANVELQSSVGCIVPSSMGTNGKVLAGTPINVNLESLQTAVKAPAAASGSGDNAVPAVPMNAVLLHDVDVSDGNANGTALIFGFVNLNRVDSTVATKISTARGITGASPLLVFMKA